MKKHTPVVLRAVKKAKVVPKPSKSTTSVRRGRGTTGEQPVGNIGTGSTSPSIHRIFTSCDPLVLRRVRAYLDKPAPADAAMLDAWERVGRQDARRNPRDLRTPQGTTAMTPLGLACVVRYLRGAEDELQSMSAEPSA
jgi:hypothetical protein